MFQLGMRLLLSFIIFLIPLFFLPWSSFPTLFSKQLALSILVFVLLIFWVAKSFEKKKVSLRGNILSLFVFLFLLVLAFSTIFSFFPRQSFLGLNLEADAFWNFFLFGLLFFFLTNFSPSEDSHSREEFSCSSLLAKTSSGLKSDLSQEKEYSLIDQNEITKNPKTSPGLKEKRQDFILLILRSFFFSSGCLSLLFLLQNFLKIFPWDFAKLSGWSPLDSPYLLSLFGGGSLGLALLFWFQLKNVSSLFFRKIISLFLVIFLILNLIVVIVVNYWLTWLGLVFLVLVSLWLNISSSFDSKKIILPVFLLVFSLVFLGVKPNLLFLNLPLEILPNTETTLRIGWQTLQEGVKNFFLGSGPATFAYQYTLYRPQILNLTDFWSARFSQGRSFLTTLLTTSGFLGVLSAFLLFLVFISQGIKKIWQALREEKDTFSCSLFVLTLYFFLFWFFYPGHFVLNFSLFVFLGLWTALFSKTIKEIHLTGHPLKVFILVLILVIGLIFSFFGLWQVSQRYWANLLYLKGLSLEQTNLDEGINKMNQAVRLEAQDVYLRGLAEAWLLKARQILENKTITPEEKIVFLQQAIQTAIDSARLAKEKNPRESFNWLELGLVYENIMPLIEGAEKLAVENYQKALQFDPQNPEIYFQIGKVYWLKSQAIKNQLESLKEQIEKEKDKKKKEELKKELNDKQNLNESYLSEAKKALEKAVNLKANYQPAQELLRELSIN
jgi:hypothetical protein